MAAGDRLQLPLQQLYAAFAAGAVTGARSVDGHIGTTSQLQEVLTLIAFDGHRASTLDLESYFHIGKILSG
jgi:hypothetical protein